MERARKWFGGICTEAFYVGFIKLWKALEGRQEIVETKDSVGCLVYNRDCQKLIFVCQERVPTFGTNPDSEGDLLEALAGHIENSGNPIAPDENRWREEEAVATMIREAQEELGITGVTAADVELLNDGRPLYLSPGILTERMTLGYMEIGDHQIEQTEREFGLAHEGERIRRFWICLDELTRWYFYDMKTYCLAQWFLREKYPQLIAQGQEN